MPINGHCHYTLAQKIWGKTLKTPLRSKYKGTFHHKNILRCRKRLDGKLDRCAIVTLYARNFSSSLTSIWMDMNYVKYLYKCLLLMGSSVRVWSCLRQGVGFSDAFRAKDEWSEPGKHWHQTKRERSSPRSRPSFPSLCRAEVRSVSRHDPTSLCSSPALLCVAALCLSVGRRLLCYRNSIWLRVIFLYMYIMQQEILLICSVVLTTAMLTEGKLSIYSKD